MKESYIFDVDGVITSPVEKKITQPELIPMFAEKLKQDKPIALISGRGLDWMKKQILSGLGQYLEDHAEMNRKLLDNLYVSGEFGGVHLTYTNGIAQESVNENFAIESKLRNKLNHKAEEFSDFAKIEHDKQTQFSMEAKGENHFLGDDGANIAEQLEEHVKDIPHLEVKRDRIGMNVKHKDANKRFATSHFLRWLEEKQCIVDKFYIFGDSPSDLEMGEELHAHHVPFEFIYVGEKETLHDTDSSFPIHFTKKLCDEGTVEYLKGL